MFKRQTKRISSLLLSATLAFTFVAPVFAEPADATEDATVIATNETDINKMTETELSAKLLETSIILKTGQSFYMKNGEKKYFNSQNMAYTPKSLNGDIYVTADIVCQILDAQSSYSKKKETFEFKKGDKTASIRIGEDAVYVNGVAKYIKTYAEDNGKGKFVPLVIVANALGYDVEEEGGLIILNVTGMITKEEYPELDSLSWTVEVSNDLTALPVNNRGAVYFPSCGFYDWGPNDGYDYTDHKGYTDEVTLKGVGHSIFLDAIPRSFMGWHLGANAFVSVNKDTYAIKAMGKFKCTEDYTNNRPVMAALWYNKNGGFFGSDFWYPEGVNSSDWTELSIVIDNALVQKRLEEGAASLSIVYGTSYNGKDGAEATGRLYVGSIDINSYSYKSALMKAAIGILDTNFSEYVSSTSFEIGEDRPGLFDWGHTGLYQTKYIDDGSVAFEGKSCAVVPAVAKSYVGYQCKAIPAQTEKKTLEISFYAKASEDFNANKPSVWLNLNKNGSFLAQRGLNADPTNNLSTEWSKLTFTLPYRYGDDGCWLPGADYDTFTPVIGSAASGVSDANPATGELYIDNVTIKYVDPSVEGTVQAATYFTNNDVGLYQLGETMNMNVKDAKDVEQFAYFTADIYDIDGNLVKSEQKIKKEFLENGFSYSPEQPGFYEIEIQGHNTDGYSYILADTYQSRTSDGNSDNCSRRYGFVFTRGEAKPMEDRSDYLMISSSCFEGEEATDPYKRGYKELDVAKRLGYSGVRIHQVKWGNAPGDRGNYTARGFGDTGQRRVYYWDNADAQINKCYDIGFKRIVPNIMGGPRWAAPEEHKNDTGYATGGWHYGLYAADKMEYVDEMLLDFTERYKGKITGIEWYNEPYYGNLRTAFWYDTMEKFAEQLAVAGKAVKKYAPELEFWGSGLLGDPSCLPFWNDVLRSEYSEDLKEVLDVISFHGTYAQMPISTIAVSEAAGFGDKKFVNSESYGFARGRTLDPETKERDFRPSCLSYIMQDMQNIRYGLDANCHFTVAAANKEYMKNGSANATAWGFLRTFGRYELYPGASTVFAWNKLMGKECEYKAEYDYGDVKAIRFDQDGKPMIAFWSTKRDGDFVMPAELQGLMGGETKLYDFELKDNIDVNNMHALKMYYLVDVDPAKADALKVTEDAAINPSYKEPVFTAEVDTKTSVPKLEDLSKDLIYYENPAEKPFDEKTWTINENIEWITDNWVWKARKDGQPAPDADKYKIKHAVHMDKDGLYIVVDVTDPTHYQTIGRDAPMNMWMGDSIQYAFNANMYGAGGTRNESEIAWTKEGTLHFKYATQDVGAMIPTGMTNIANLYPDDRGNVKLKPDGLTYFIFLPESELFPYTYGSYDYARLSIIVNNTDDDTGSQGYFEWGSGIGATKSVEPYVVLTFPELKK